MPKQSQPKCHGYILQRSPVGRIIMRSLLILGICLIGMPVLFEAPAHGDDATKNDFFNGKDFDGWEGLMDYWSIKDGAIVGTAPAEGLKFNTFLCSKKK